jgi:muramoyltetrapeptide carboxypeptidase
VTGHPIKPPALRPGDTVGVIAPAAALEREYLERGVSALVKLGYRVKVSEHALDRAGVFAGGDEVRATELHRFFADPEVKAVFAARGGYGAGRLLPMIDFEAIARKPKILMGFSDLTFLLNAFVKRAGMVTFHGPMVAMDLARGLGPRALDQLRGLLAGEMRSAEFEAREVVCPGTAEGEVVGGCLSVIVAMLGTPYAPDFRGRILFLEDTGEKAYRIDRMLVHLRQAGALDQIAGLVFGGMRAADGSEQEKRMIAQFIAEQTTGLRCPVLGGLEAGHGTEHLTIPLGLRARLDSPSRRLLFTEAAVS